MASQFIKEKNLMIVSFIKKTVQKSNPLSNLLVKINFFHRELMAANFLLIQCLNHLYSLESVKLMLI